MNVSKKGAAFIATHEGDVLTCYLDAAGVPTIGKGFTMRSAAVKAALAKIGITKLVAGKTKITKAQSDAIFLEVLNSDEFLGTVQRLTPKNRIVKQHMLDAMVSAVYNLGPKFMQWNWIKPWRDNGDVSGSARIWSNNYNKANGKTLNGLVRRRKEEANLFENGVYANVKAVSFAPEAMARDEIDEAPKVGDPTVEEAQQILSDLGFDPGKIDGWYGTKTKAAIKAYQMVHPHLDDDGILGIATLTQLRKDAGAVKDIAKNVSVKGGGASLFAGVGAFFSGLPWGWIVGGVIVAAIIYFGWRYRDVILRKVKGV